jgi:sortase (surface protein transpeptidase)
MSRTPGRLRPVPVLTALLGLAVLVTAGADIARDRSVPGAFGATAAPSTVTRLAPTSRLAGRASRTAPPARVLPAAPALLTIPVLQVQAAVVPVGVTGGILDVPAGPAQVGWWSASALAGSTTGSVVIDGHVDSAATGPGALFHLTDLSAGDRLVVTTTSGARRSYVVTGRRVYPKTGGLPADLFAIDGPPRLVLITCGGPFDRAAGSYLDNIVVFAEPEDETQRQTEAGHRARIPA